jgi:hypothetical protein
MTTEAQAETPTGPVGLGGWMILPILSMIIAPIVIVVGVASTFKSLVSGSFFELSNALQIFGFLETLANIFFAIAWIYALYLCFTWDENFPKVYMLLLAANLAVQTLDLMIAVGFFDLKTTDQDGRGYGQAVLECLIWVPYMMKSKRVRNTFRPVP